MKYALLLVDRMHLISAGLVVFICLLPAPSAHAMDCLSADSDPDGDGWGWENNMSCRVVENTTAPLSPPTPPVCEFANSDSDNDGWGWENNASCIVDNSNGNPDTAAISPGSSAANATPISPGTPISGNHSGPDNEHWYSVTIADSSTATLITVNSVTDFAQSINLEDSEGRVLAYFDSFTLLDSPVNGVGW